MTDGENKFNPFDEFCQVNSDIDPVIDDNGLTGADLLKVITADGITFSGNIFSAIQFRDEILARLGKDLLSSVTLVIEGPKTEYNQAMNYAGDHLDLVTLNILPRNDK